MESAHLLAAILVTALVASPLPLLLQRYGRGFAVLAALPLQYGIAGGEIIRDTTYMVVLISISLTAVLVMAYPAPAVRNLYSRLLGKPPGDTLKVPAFTPPAD